MKQFLIVSLLSIAFSQIHAQQVNSDWTVYSEHSSQPSAAQAQLPELTMAKESIEVEGDVMVASNTAVTFRTLPEGYIHLASSFKVEKGAFFHAHKANFESPNTIEKRTATTDLAINTFPNPFVDQVILEFELPSATTVNIMVHNELGQLVQQVAKAKVLEKGVQQVIINTSAYVAGVYYFQVAYDEQQLTTTLIKQ